ncbi:MAG TPA: hypothetical protein PLZ84_03860, partial [Clostridia bacterium]|nr:hypothetical protein [Clostridia bacterium]
GPGKLCFADNHGHRRGEFIFKMDNQLIEEFRAIAPKDFLICGENAYDMQMQVYDISYFRSYGRGETPSKRYVRPKNAKYMIAVTGFDDRDTINKCLLCNYIVSYEPYFFKGMPSDFPLTINYGMQMQQLREETQEYTWYGEFMATLGAEVTDGSGKKHPHYSVFKADSGKRAVVIVNYTAENATYTVKLDSGRIARWKAVGGEWRTDEVIEIPARTAVVAIEE